MIACGWEVKTVPLITSASLRLSAIGQVWGELGLTSPGGAPSTKPETVSSFETILDRFGFPLFTKFEQLKYKTLELDEAPRWLSSCGLPRFSTAKKWNNIFKIQKTC